MNVFRWQSEQFQFHAQRIVIKIYLRARRLYHIYHDIFILLRTLFDIRASGKSFQKCTFRLCRVSFVVIFEIFDFIDFSRVHF